VALHQSNMLQSVSAASWAWCMQEQTFLAMAVADISLFGVLIVPQSTTRPCGGCSRRRRSPSSRDCHRNSSGTSTWASTCSRATSPRERRSQRFVTTTFVITTVHHWDRVLMMLHVSCRGVARRAVAQPPKVQQPAALPLTFLLYKTKYSGPLLRVPHCGLLDHF